MSSPGGAFTEDQFSFGGLSLGSGGNVELLALVAFVGTILFCAVQAMVAPRRTFCAEQQPARKRR